MRPSVRLPLVCLLGIAAVLGVPAAPAHATAYRYWSYWHAAPGSSSWGFAGSGPTYRPSPGAVEGWRFAVSPGTTSAPAPRTDPAKAYTRACGSRTASSGQKLVALVVDYGTSSDAPAGETPPAGVVATCTEIASNGTGFQVLADAGVAVRTKDGLVCGLNGYPRSECATIVRASASPTPSPASSRSSATHSSPASSASRSARSSSRAPSSTLSAVAATATAKAQSSAGKAHSSAPPSPSSSAAGASAPASTPPSAPPSASAAGAAAEPSLAVGDVSSNAPRGRPWGLVAGVVLLLLLATVGLRARRRA